MLAVSHVIVTVLTVFSTSCSIAIIICVEMWLRKAGDYLTSILRRIVLGVQAHCQHRLSKMRAINHKQSIYWCNTKINQTCSEPPSLSLLAGQGQGAAIFRLGAANNCG